MAHRTKKMHRKKVNTDFSTIFLSFQGIDFRNNIEEHMNMSRSVSKGQEMNENYIFEKWKTPMILSNTPLLTNNIKILNKILNHHIIFRNMT